MGWNHQLDILDAGGFFVCIWKLLRWFTRGCTHSIMVKSPDLEETPRLGRGLFGSCGSFGRCCQGPRLLVVPLPANLQISIPDAPCMDYLPTKGEKLATFKEHVRKYSLHGPFGYVLDLANFAKCMMVVCFMCVAGIGSDSCGNMCCFSCCKTRLLPCKLQVKTGFWIGGLEGNEDVLGHRYLICHPYHPIPSAPNLLSTWGFSIKCWCRGTCNRGTARWCESLRCTKLLIYAIHWSVNWMISGSAYMFFTSSSIQLLFNPTWWCKDCGVECRYTEDTGMWSGCVSFRWSGPSNPNTFPHLSWGQQSTHLSCWIGCCWVYQPLHC